MIPGRLTICLVFLAASRCQFAMRLEKAPSAASGSFAKDDFAQPRIHASPGMLRRAAPRNRAGLPSGEVTNSFARRSAGRAVAASQRSPSAQRPSAASRVPLRRRAPELVTSPPGSPAHAQSRLSRLPPRKLRSCADSGARHGDRSRTGRPPSGRGAAATSNFRELWAAAGRPVGGLPVVNAPRWTPLLVATLAPRRLSDRAPDNRSTTHGLPGAVGYNPVAMPQRTMSGPFLGSGS